MYGLAVLAYQHQLPKSTATSKQNNYSAEQLKILELPEEERLCFQVQDNLYTFSKCTDRLHLK